MSKIAEFRLSTKNAHGVESRCWVYCSRALTYRGGAGRRLMRIKVNPNEGVLCQLFAARTFPWLDWRSKPFRVSLSTCRPRRREYAVLSWDGGIHALVTRDRRRVSPSFEDAPWVLLHGLWELLEECGLRPDEVVYLTARHCR